MTYVFGILGALFLVLAGVARIAEFRRCNGPHLHVCDGRRRHR